MPVLIGTDEAGYGPNLGPLVITATTWHLPDGMVADDLPGHLESVVSADAKHGDTRLQVADSKQVYSSGKSIAGLERSVLSFLKVLGELPHSVQTLGTTLAGDRFAADYAEMCGAVIDEQPLPIAADIAECDARATELAAVLQQAGVRLLNVQSRILFPPEFNRLVAIEQSKGRVLSAATLALIRSATDHPQADRHGWVVSDKHGGRNRYDDLISTAFDDGFVFRLEESRPQSRYRLNNLEFCFRTKAEAVLPVALASMVCKYVREAVMLQFNAFWKHHLPELKPTKGYPVDAKRFRDDIQTKAQELNMDASQFWRIK